MSCFFVLNFFVFVLYCYHIMVNKVLDIMQDEFSGLTCNTPLKSAAFVIFKFHNVVQKYS